MLTSMSEDEIGEVLAIDDALDSVADEAALLRVIARVRVVGALAAAAAKEPEIAPSSPAPPSASALAEWLRATRLRFVHDGDGKDDDDESSEGVADVAPPQPTVGGRLEVLYDSACWWPATVVAIKSGAGPDPAAATLVTVRFDDGEETEEVAWPEDDVRLAPSRSAAQERTGARVVSAIADVLERARVDTRLLFLLADVDACALVDAAHRVALAASASCAGGSTRASAAAAAAASNAAGVSAVPPFDDADAVAARRALCAAVRAVRVAARRAHRSCPRALPCSAGARGDAAPWTGVVIGDTGAGKSTCLNALLGEVRVLMARSLNHGMFGFTPA